MPIVLVACDASPSIGLGHLRRSVALARALRARGARIHFVCRAREVDVARDIAEVADDWSMVEWMPAPADVEELARRYAEVQALAAVVDRYGMSDDSQRALAQAGVRWLQFDGAAVRPLWGDWVVNPSPTATEAAYRGCLRRPGTRLLLGPQFAPVRDEFRHARSPRPRGALRSILLTFGGGDDRGATRLCLEALRPLADDIETVAIVSDANPAAPALRAAAAGRTGVRLVYSAAPAEVAKEMAAADLAIIGGGTTTFEAAAMGVPMLIVRVAPNQAVYAHAWEEVGAARDLGPLDVLGAEAIAAAVRALMADPDRRAAMSRVGASLVDARGADRVAGCVLTDIEEMAR